MRIVETLEVLENNNIIAIINPNEVVAPPPIYKVAESVTPLFLKAEMGFDDI